ncbi:MAG: hypothetical protein CMH56_08235 [Myxococcales bacterium]|mgnify:CR=1 FL=1|nr:hypothetical protein [Myxococcales bacterium]|tara:strand:- start:1871 stop:2782 length:912 start_codon:yes stop_codon:yes gene_type:complete
MLRSVWALSAALVLATGCGGHESASKAPLKKPVMQTPLTLGITATISFEIAKKDGTRLEQLMSESLGEPVSIQVYASYSSLVDALVAGMLDLAWMPPLAYVKARRQAQVIPIRKATRAGHASYKSVLFTKKDSKLKSPADLKGTRVGWVSQLSSSGYVFPRVLLMDAGINPNGFFGEEVFLDGHLAVCEAVANGTVDVGATFTDDIFEQIPKRVSACAKMGVFADDTFKVLSATPEVPSDVIVARVGLDPMMIKSVGTALDGMANIKDLRAQLGRSLDADGFIEVGMSDYMEVERALEVLESE